MQSRKIKALALFLVLLLIILIPIVILESRRTPDWQATLEQYLELSGTLTPGNRLVEMAEARHPEQFAFQMVSTVPR